MSQTYSVYNPNPYKLTVSSVSTRLITETSRKNAVGQMVAYVVVGQGAFPAGTNQVDVPATGWKDLMIYYNFNTTSNPAAGIVYNLQECCTASSAFTTTGSFDMSTSVHDYNGVNLGTLLTLVSCEGPRCT